MSAALRQGPRYPFPSDIKTLKTTTNSQSSHSYKNKSVFPLDQFRCELSSSFDNRWTVDCVTDNNPIHIILKPPNSMASSSSSSTLKRSKKVCLFHCAEMKALAESIVAESDTIELRSITWRYYFYSSILVSPTFWQMRVNLLWILL